MKHIALAIPPRSAGAVALIVFALCLLPAPLRAQGTRADYQRAAGLARATQNKVLNLKLEPGWLPDNRHFWYRRELPGGAWEFVLVEVEQGVKQPAFDHGRLAAALGKARQKEIVATRLPVSRLEFATNRLSFKFLSEGKRWNCDLGSYEVVEEKGASVSLTARAGDDAPRATRRNGAETGLTFVNQMTSEVELFWLDADGRRQSYGKLRPGEQREQHTFAGHVWLVADGDGATLAVFEADEGGGLAEITGRAGARGGRARTTPAKPPGQSPDGQWTAFVRNHNLFLRAKGDGKEQQLSFDGNPDDSYGEEVKWSPDSKKLVSLRTLKEAEHKVYLVESSPADQLQPKLHTLDYLKPGDRVASAKPQLFDVATRRQIPVDDALFPNPYELRDLRWEPDSRRFTFIYNQRGHQILRMVAVDAGTGAATAVVDEQSPTFIDYAHKQFTHYLEETRELVWMSERDGWCQLYLYDTATGQVKNQITRGEWVVRGVIRVDERKRQIWFRASGIRSGEDPYYIHLCRINLDGSGLVILTEGDGTHIATLAPERAAFVDTWSRVDQPPVHQLRKLEDGKLLCELERADAGDLVKTGWRAPERFVAKARDGVTDIFGVIIRPTNFDTNKQYPVIEQIYAGPQGAFVPKDFRAFYGMQELAELGFIVVQMDGMGTSYRSKKFHDVCAKNLGDAGLPDRILWIKAAAAKYPYMDLDRVGIYGGSAGGQNSTGALLTHGDFYKVGVSDCGCHDNRMDKIWWNELWMGWPIGPHYEAQSNVTLAKNLQGKLMLVAGELDRNVDPASTMQVANALIKADKDFDLVIIPGAGHGSAESPYGKRRRADFFVRHLLGVEPRSH